MSTHVLQLDPTGRLRFIPVLIRGGQAVSDPVDLLNYQIKGVIMPGAWTAATITFFANKILTDDGGYLLVDRTGGAPVAITAGANQYVVLVDLDHETMAGLRFVKVQSSNAPGTNPIPQAADRYLILVCAVSHN